MGAESLVPMPSQASGPLLVISLASLPKASPLHPSRLPPPKHKTGYFRSIETLRSRLHHWLHLPQAPNFTGQSSQPLRVPVFPSILTLASVSGPVYSPYGLFLDYFSANIVYVYVHVLPYGSVRCIVLRL
jgi:hypothetical protein